MGFFSIDDPVAPYGGGPGPVPGIDLLSFAEFGEQWAAINDCEAPQPGDRVFGAESDTWSNCAAPVVMWTLTGAGHSWPMRTTSTDIDASSALWQFFSTHNLQ